MAKTQSITRKQNHDYDASSSSGRKRIRTFDDDGEAPWSDLNNRALHLVMMKLGVVNFLTFSGVCKSWRSFTLSYRNTYMASRPPLSLDIDPRANNQDLEDFEGRRFKTILPHSGGRICIGVTCGYLILFGRETRDLWLVNPITRYPLHFPDFPLCVGACEVNIRAILVFSSSISGWVLVAFHKKCWHITSKHKISLCIAGKRRWNHVYSALPFLDLHAFKGKIYTLHTSGSLCEPRLNLKQKWKSTLLKIKDCPKPNLGYSELVSSGENLYMVQWGYNTHVLELDFGEMKCVSPKKKLGEYAFFLSMSKSSVAFKLGSWSGPPTKYKNFNYHDDTDKSQQHKRMWYFPMNV